MRNNEKTAFGVLFSICFCHMINDMLQSLLAAIYPTLKSGFHLSFAQIGLVTLAYQLTASLLQPAVGLYADRRPTPFSLPGGTLFTFAGLLTLSLVRSYSGLLIGAGVLGIGSSVFHPESSRVARMAAGRRAGLAQSLFQVGGSIGSALGPLAAAVIVLRSGRRGLLAFSLCALLSTAILTGVGVWYKRRGLARLTYNKRAQGEAASARSLSAKRVMGSMAVLLMLIFSKFVYLASLASYYTFYLIDRFGVSVHGAQMRLFALSAAVTVGTLAGGPLGDRIGRKPIIWFSILGALPFTLALPYANLFWTGALSLVIGFVLASAFPAMVVYGQELIPGRVGMVSGMFFGLSFGAAGLGAALLGLLADATSIEHVYRVVSFLPALGLLAALLPTLRGNPRRDHPKGGSRTAGIEPATLPPVLSCDE